MHFHHLLFFSSLYIKEPRNFGEAAKHALVISITCALFSVE